MRDLIGLKLLEHLNMSSLFTRLQISTTNWSMAISNEFGTKFQFWKYYPKKLLYKLLFAVTWISSCCSIACAGRTQSEWNPYSETQDILHDPKLAHRPLLGLKHWLLLLWRSANHEKNVQQALRDVQSMPNNWKTRQFLNRRMTLHKVQPNVEILYSYTFEFIIYSLFSLNVTSMRSSFPSTKAFLLNQWLQAKGIQKVLQFLQWLCSI